MIDRTKIFVRARLNSKRFTKTDLGYIEAMGCDNYRLYSNRDKAYLEIWNSATGVYIDGSWRKWYLGSDSLNDLTRKDIKTVCEEISKITGLSMTALLNSILCVLEFGCTFFLSVFPATILGRMYRYSSLELGRFDTSISFRAHDFWFAIYDKGIEVIKRGCLRGNTQLTQETNALRMELKVFARTAFEDRLRGIETLADVINNYRNLIISFYHEIKRIEIQPIILEIDNVTFKGKKISDFNKYAKLRLMEQIGVRQTFGMIGQLDMANSGKSYQRKKLSEILAQYTNRTAFSRADFLTEVRTQLVKKIAEPNPLL